MRRYLSITLMLICGFAQTSPALSPSTQDEIIDEEYAVYAALFGENRKVAVIQTSEYRDTSELWEEIKREEATKNSFSKIGFSNSLSQSTIRDYISRNHHLRPLKNLFKTDARCIIVSRAEIEELYI